MSVIYKRLPAAISRDREYVSAEQYLLLTLLHTEGLDFNVNEGHRTMARQFELVREQGVWSPSNPHGAAVPSANAPHIRTGSPAHALDIQDVAQAVINAAAKHGVTYTRTVPTESWHIEPGLLGLLSFYRRETKARATLRRKVKVLRRRGHGLIRKGKAVLARAKKVAR